MTNEEFIKANSLPNEEWRDVVGFEDRYMVSSLGRVFAKGKTQYNKNKKRHTYIEPHFKKPYNRTQRRGDIRMFITLHDRNTICKALHRVIAEAFIPNPNNLPCIDHIDGNPLNNSIDNLRWSSSYDNLHNPATYYKMCKAVCQIKDGKLIKVWPSLTEAMQIGCTLPGITRCCRGGRRTHRGYQWMYLSDWENSRQ